jgi:hypothetical protein
MERIRFLLLVLISVGMMHCTKEDDEVIDPGIDVVINELMPKNSKYVSDQNGQFDDWIELHNRSDEDTDISGYYLSDSRKELTKWQFTEGTVIAANGYLVIWADGDISQEGLHTPYKLAAEGEKVVFSSPGLEIIDEVEYPAYPGSTTEQSYARIPDGTGDFTWTSPTFNTANGQ